MIDPDYIQPFALVRKTMTVPGGDNQPRLPGKPGHDMPPSMSGQGRRGYDRPCEDSGEWPRVYDAGPLLVNNRRLGHPDSSGLPLELAEARASKARRRATVVATLITCALTGFFAQCPPGSTVCELAAFALPVVAGAAAAIFCMAAPENGAEDALEAALLPAIVAHFAAVLLRSAPQTILESLALCAVTSALVSLWISRAQCLARQLPADSTRQFRQGVVASGCLMIVIATGIWLITNSASFISFRAAQSKLGMVAVILAVLATPSIAALCSMLCGTVSSRGDRFVGSIVGAGLAAAILTSGWLLCRGNPPTVGEVVLSSIPGLYCGALSISLALPGAFLGERILSRRKP